MEHLPQQEKVKCCVLFHTPRLRNNIEAILGICRGRCSLRLRTHQQSAILHGRYALRGQDLRRGLAENVTGVLRELWLAEGVEDGQFWAAVNLGPAKQPLVSRPRLPSLASMSKRARLWWCIWQLKTLCPWVSMFIPLPWSISFR